MKESYAALPWREGLGERDTRDLILLDLRNGRIVSGDIVGAEYMDPVGMVVSLCFLTSVMTLAELSEGTCSLRTR